MNILFCSAGRRAELLKDFRKSLSVGSRIIATDMSPYAPAVYFADCHYEVPEITEPSYLEKILDICKKEKIDVITTLIDPEIALLAKNREIFTEMGITVLAPYEKTAELCFDKFELFKHLKKCGIPTADTYGTFESAVDAIQEGKLNFPVFVKPRTGSGSVGARRVYDLHSLREACLQDPSLIIQELMDCEDMDADVYIDTVSGRPVSIFTKRKLETKIGGANKTVSFKDPAARDFLCKAMECFEFCGPIDVDLFYKNGQYYLSEVNPRFGGAYLHAYGAGVDFVKLIENNAQGISNEPCFDNYEDGIVMMMYDSVVFTKV